MNEDPREDGTSLVAVHLPAVARAGSDSPVPPSKAAEGTSENNDEFSSSRQTCALVHSVVQRFVIPQCSDRWPHSTHLCEWSSPVPGKVGGRGESMH